MVTILDIGAGGCSFAKALRRMNPLLRRTARFVCGEPGLSRVFDPNLGIGRIQEIQASYEDFRLPDNSLNLVTMNAREPLSSDSGMEGELLRTLRLGGCFVSAHPVRIHPVLNPRDFRVILFKDRLGKEHDELPFEGVSIFIRPSACFATQFLMNGERIFYPASTYIWNRLLVCRANESGVSVDYRSYWYRNRQESPSLKVWVRV